MASGRIQRFLHDEAAPGIVLIVAAAPAIMLANWSLHATINPHLQDGPLDWAASNRFEL